MIFFSEKKNYGNYILWELIFADRKKNPAKIRIAKNSVPHGNWRYVRTRPYMQDAPMWKVTLRDISRYCIPGGMHELAPICKTPQYVR